MKKLLCTAIPLFILAIQVLSSESSIMHTFSEIPVADNVISNSISNSFLTVTYNPTVKSLEAVSKQSGKTILTLILPAGITGHIVKENFNNPSFGRGNGLVLATSDGGSVLFALYPDQPFLFITQTVNNKSGEILDIQKLNPVSFLIHLDKPADQLKTMGTGGLLDPDKNPGSYVFLTTVDPATRHGVVAGWLTHEKGSGVLFSALKNNEVEIKAQVDYGHYLLPPGKSGVSETLVIGYFDDARIGEELFADALAKQYKIKLRDRSATYCTWYSEKNGGAGTESSTIELAGFVQKNLKRFGLGVIQIDDQWQDGGSYNGPARGFDRVRKIPLEKRTENGKTYPGYPANYKNGMEPVAKTIKNAGLSAGIWWMPFARNHQDPEYANRQHWFAKRSNGQPYETPWGGTSLDLTNPEVLRHVSYVSKKLMSWGFDYFKMDGLWTGTVTEQIYINDGFKNDSMGNCKPLYNQLITQIEAFRNGLKLINKITGGKVFLSGCCISQNMRSFGASIGLVHAMRIGPDYSHEDGIKTGPIRGSRLYFLNGRVWWNDPDPAVIREQGIAGADPSSKGVGNLQRSLILPTFAAVSGQFYLSSDWLPDLPAERLEIMKRTMASHTGIARPVDAFDKNLPSIWIASDNKTGIERNVIGLFNWDTTRSEISSSLTWAGLKDDSTYHAFDFWGNKPLSDVSGSFKYNLDPESCRVISLRARANHPVIVSTSQHVTQGMIDLLTENWENKTLSATCRLIEGDAYEIRIAGLNNGGGWKVDSLTVVDDEGPLTIGMLPQTETGWLRVIMKSETSQVVKWQVKFKQQ